MTSHPAFIQVGALADGFAPNSHILAPVADLEGRTFVLTFTDGAVQTLRFGPASSVDVERTTAGAAPTRKCHACRVTSVRAGIYFVDYVDASGSPIDESGKPVAVSTSYVLDLKKQLCTLVTGLLPGEKETRIDAFTRVELGMELTGVQAEIRHGVIGPDAEFNGTALHQPTTELIGMRNLYTYSATERYEHIYLNENFYAWQCLSGVEAGLGDVDRCHTIGIDTALYLFVWREKVVPTLGVLMIDLERMKTDGKIFGYEGSRFDALSNFPVGAHAVVLNVTRHPG
ncbi:molybdenum cofactor biosynthesis protein F [bacterium M00.F.Ca.ET.228.01.1.1]|uniref:MoaF C-terminal domain-containing protein n=1 Tax=Paraburkholderia phenoliruptrix TaxID=252970 RepID=UPI001091D1A8|nr:MoaF C-terminal domain-containing protein [Paraburkholderia phenoliruptrix]TGP41495.1 molybdenum cofactor biosynthesis protein F [bacterium M00.F.Ca.ET.228.01.1.1]TGR98152.1 molybdenum cofactor biosynthesis protein F [bacterium M00.F.Ca.ET.191.01.1.1]TGU02343.1 molybdenum cofactor biosynthesis protein F [bacterium M00.F.Ca.ET.155.01.1.1]MBW0447143.1 MoaF N-terminal domain-containing protein [Paraburkholderia phenoliruptrix]MBW9101474.1 MoaF N-terminal domain-containing protein [Paraburkhold